MTEKKVKRHLKRIWFHYVRLQRALNDAHHADVIVYSEPYSEVAPCWAMDELKKRITLTTRDQLVNAVNQEMRQNVRGY